MDPRYFDKISDEILEKILLDVPTSQIQFNGPWVCKTWRKIIWKRQFWVQKLKKDGFVIENERGLWSLLGKKKCDNKETAACLYYAALYREYTKTGTREKNKVYDFFDTVPYTDLEWREFTVADVTINNDNAVFMISGVLLCRTFCHIILRLNIEVINGLPLLLQLIKTRKAQVILRDNYAYWKYSPRINYLQLLKGQTDKYGPPYLRKFWGCLLTLKGLPKIRYLSLSIAVDEQNKAIDPGLANICEDYGLDLHLKAGTNITHLQAVSFQTGIRFFVSDLEESQILWMAEATKKFLDKEVLALVFFNYQLDLKATENMFKSMVEAGFKVEDGPYSFLDIAFLSPVLPLDSVKALNDLAFTLWPIQNPVKISIFSDEDEFSNHLCDKMHIDFPDKI